MIGTIGVDRLRAPADLLARRQLTMVRLDRLCFLRSYRPGGWCPQLRLEGQGHLDRALARGRGAILWVAPTVFQWLPGKRTMFEAGYRLHHLSSPEHGFSSRSRFGRTWLQSDPDPVEKIATWPSGWCLARKGNHKGSLRRLTGLLRQNAVVSIAVGAAGARALFRTLAQRVLDRGERSASSRGPHRCPSTAAVHDTHGLWPLSDANRVTGRITDHRLGRRDRGPHGRWAGPPTRALSCSSIPIRSPGELKELSRRGRTPVFQALLPISRTVTPLSAGSRPDLAASANARPTLVGLRACARRDGRAVPARAALVDPSVRHRLPVRRLSGCRDTGAPSRVHDHQGLGHDARRSGEPLLLRAAPGGIPGTSVSLARLPAALDSWLRPPT